jgi:hypothetical protein
MRAWIGSFDPPSSLRRNAFCGVALAQILL